MAPGKYSRVDGRKSSNYCSTVVIVGFVALCLVGVWMLMSSSAVPVQNSEFSSQETTDSVITQPIIKEDSKQFEDSSGDLPDGGSKGEDNTESSQDEKENTTQNETENVVDENQEKSDEKSDEKIEEKTEEKNEPNEDPNTDTESKQDAFTNSKGGETEDGSGGDKSESNESDKKPQTEETFPAGAQSELLNETTTQNGAWSTQATESQNEKEAQQTSVSKDQTNHGWKLCNVVAGPDYIPCLDNLEAINKLHGRGHFEHRERHCPEQSPTCLVPLPEGYKIPVKWPKSRDMIWYYNVPHTKLAEVKGHQNWVKVTGEYLTFPGGGTQFKNGALHYIDFIQESVPDIAWGKQTRVILDVGCGVASFGGFLFERDVLAMSFAPKDEHEAQVQFALERGIPAISAVMGTARLPFPSRVFDAVHCARCRVPWHVEGGKLLLELNRVLRPGGHFLWSATPVYQKLPEDVEIWKAMTELTKKMCWELLSITNDQLNQVGVAVYRKPTTNECYEQRSENEPPLCKESDDPNAAWYVPLEACLHKVPVDETERGSKWPEQWPARVGKAPYWLKSSQVGVYGKAAPEDFKSDYEHWKHVVNKSYLKGLGIDWSSVRNVMDMRAVYGGFAAALKDLKVWVMNIVPIDSPDTLPIIYERGLFGMYHDWCESHSTYPRSYDLLHADHLFSTLKKRCKIEPVIVEIDRILRPEGKLIVRDNVKIIQEIESLAKSLQWEVRLTYSKDNEGLLCLKKTFWRPTELENSITI